jgi:choline kinase
MVTQARHSVASNRDNTGITRAVLLSAGQGKRLLPLTQDRPKCAIEFFGRSVVEWQIDALFDAGFEEVSVVLGYGADGVEAMLAQRYDGSRVRTIYNPFFRLTDNLATCWVAREVMDDDFLLINGDTLFEPDVVRALMAAIDQPITLTVDHKDAYDGDDMKVVQDELGQPRRIGKQLPLAEVSAESIGMIAFTGSGPALFRQAIERYMRSDNALSLWYLSVVDELAGSGHVGACSVGDRLWSEMDDHNDLADVQKVIAAIAQYAPTADGDRA